MSKLKMEYLEYCFEKAKEHKVGYVAVMVEMGMKDHEVIINPIINADEKLAYYKKAYTDDLVLKANENIKIVGFTYGNGFAEIQWDLLGV